MSDSKARYYTSKQIVLLDKIKRAEWYLLEDLKKIGWSIPDLNLAVSKGHMIKHDIYDEWRLTLDWNKLPLPLCCPKMGDLFVSTQTYCELQRRRSGWIMSKEMFGRLKSEIEFDLKAAKVWDK